MGSAMLRRKYPQPAWLSTGQGTSARLNSARDIVWPGHLKDPQVIAGYISEQSSYELCEEQIEEQFHGCRARLAWIEISMLTLGHDDHNLREEVRQAKADSLPVATMPPLLVEDNLLQDGYHLLRRLLADGATHYWAYVVEEAPENALEVKPVKASK